MSDVQHKCDASKVMWHLMNITHSLTLDSLTCDGSLHPPDVAIASHVPSNICNEPDIDLQLADPRLLGMTSTTCHQVGDRQPDEVLHVRVLILADDVHDRILRFACLGFCCACFVAGSGSLLTRLVQSWTSIFQETVEGKTFGWTRAFVRLTLLGSRFLHHTAGRRQQGHCTVTAWCTDLILTSNEHANFK